MLWWEKSQGIIGPWLWRKDGVNMSPCVRKAAHSEIVAAISLGTFFSASSRGLTGTMTSSPVSWL